MVKKLMLLASDLVSGTWRNVVGPTASWISDQNAELRGFTLFVDGYDLSINGGKSVLHEGEYYYEWGYIFKDSDLDGNYEVNIDYRDELGDKEGITYVDEGFDEILGRYFCETNSDDRPADNGTWDRNPNRSNGQFDGDELGIFEVDVPLDFTGSEFDDEIVGTTLEDQILLLGGNDFVDAAAGNDIVKGGLGHDNIIGGYGSDKLFGNAGRDILKGGNDNDRVFGSKGFDRLFGEEGNDRLVGGKGADTLIGGEGKDRLNGGLGKDTLTGGSGKDIFYLSANTGKDTITDYGTGNDQLKLTGGLTESDLTIRQSGADVRIKYDGDLMVIVQNTLVDDLTFI